MGVRRRLWASAAAFLALVAIALTCAAWVWRVDLAQALLDPGVPYPLYQPPPAPAYAQRSAWALLPAAPARPGAGEPGADVFFVHPTTYDHGREWNGPVDDARAAQMLGRVMLPNYAGPFQRVGRVFAPRYRQAGLYSFTTLRDDAREARRFAYRDVRAAFDLYLSRFNGGRPFIIAGVEQGGELVARLAAEAASDPRVLARLAAVYIQDAVVPAGDYGATSRLPACSARSEAHCVVGWAEAPPGSEADARTLLDRALVWNRAGQLENLDGRPALCVNPLTGAEHGAAGRRAGLGAANASGLAWGERPAFLPRQVSAVCRGGLLRVGRPWSPDLRSAPSWSNPLKAPPYNLFYADIEADAKARLQALTGRRGGVALAPPIETSVAVRPALVHRID